MTARPQAIPSAPRPRLKKAVEPEHPALPVTASTSSEPVVILSIRVAPDFRQSLRAAAVQRRTSVQELVTSAVLTTYPELFA